MPDRARIAIRLIVAITPIEASAKLKTVPTACSAPQITIPSTASRSTKMPVSPKPR